VIETRRRLPHVYPQDRWLFVTWHLHGSLLPGHYPPPHKSSAGHAFVWIDRQLDRANCSPVYLRQEPIARLVVDSLERGVELGHYQLGPFVVMANPVHVLLLPLVPPSHLLKSLKGSTAREANRLLGRTGEPFRQRESYDHWVRNEAEWNRIAAYIENNPVKAGLVAGGEDYPWSSARAKCVRHSNLQRPLVRLTLMGRSPGNACPQRRRAGEGGDRADRAIALPHWSTKGRLSARGRGRRQSSSRSASSAARSLSNGMFGAGIARISSTHHGLAGSRMIPSAAKSRSS